MLLMSESALSLYVRTRCNSLLIRFYVKSREKFQKIFGSTSTKYDRAFLHRKNKSTIQVDFIKAGYFVSDQIFAIFELI